MNRLFVCRPILFCALYLSLGLLISYFILAQKIVELIIALILFLIIPITLLIFACLNLYNKKHNKDANQFQLFCKKHCKLLLILPLCAVIGISLFNISASIYQSGKLDNEKCQIVGVVTKSVVNKENYMSFYLRDCEVYLTDGTKQNLSGLTRVYSHITQGNMPEKVMLGTKISFPTTLQSTNLLTENGEIDSFNYKFNIKHTCVLNQRDKDKIVISYDRAKLNEQINAHVLDMLLLSMEKENAFLAWSVLFGDSTQLNENVVDAFKVSGVMHIIAVSGMNVAIIIAVLFGILALFDVNNKKVQFFIPLAFLLVYCWLCAWTPSVVRASIMALVMLLANLTFHRGDLLSNIGFSAIIILVMQPLMLFEPGFLLSYGSLIGIILLNRPIYKFFRKKLHFPKYIALSISTTISAQIGILPILAYFFGYISTYSFLANLVIIPIFEFAYVVLFILVFVVALIPALSYFMFLPDQLFTFINWFPTLFMSLDFAIIPVFKMGLYTIIYVALVLLCSKFVFVNKKWRVGLTLSLSVVLCFGVVVSYVKPINDNYFMINTHRGASTLLIDNHEKMLVGVGNDYRDASEINDALLTKRIYDLQSIVLWQKASESEQSIANFYSVALKYTPSKILLSPHYNEKANLIEWLNAKNIDYASIPKETALELNGVKYQCYGENSYAMSILQHNTAYIFYENKKAYKKYNSILSQKIKKQHYNNVYAVFSGKMEKV